MIDLRGSKLAFVYHNIEPDSESNITRFLTMNYLNWPTPRLTKSLVKFQIQSFVLLKIEKPAVGVPKSK